MNLDYSLLCYSANALLRVVCLLLFNNLSDGLDFARPPRRPGSAETAVLAAEKVSACASSENPKGALPVWVSRPWAVGIRLATSRGPHIDRYWILLSLGVDTHIDGGIKTVLNLASDERDLHDGVVTTLRTHSEEKVLGVESLRLLVGVIGGGFFNLGKEVLLNVELADVGDCATLNGVVGQLGSAVVDDG